MTSANLALIGAFVALPFLGFLCFRFSHKALDSLAVAKIASVAGVGFFALWLIATVGLSVALFPNHGWPAPLRQLSLYSQTIN